MKNIIIGHKASKTSNDILLNTSNNCGFESTTFSKFLNASEFCKGKNNNITITIGPIEHNPVTPNESPLLFLPPLTLATPAPNVNKNGTVTGPVVTPLLSKEISKIVFPFFPNKHAKANIIK